jgi:hypothetical protein
MNEMLKDRGLHKVIDSKVYVIGIKGPLENRWQEKVGQFAAALLNGG